MDTHKVLIADNVVTDEYEVMSMRQFMPSIAGMSACPPGAEHIECPHQLQRLTQAERDAFFDLCHDILPTGGTLRVVTPFWKSALAMCDPGAVPPYFSETSFLKYADKWDQNATVTFTDGTWMDRTEEARAFAMRHYVDVVNQLIVDFKKK